MITSILPALHNTDFEIAPHRAKVAIHGEGYDLSLENWRSERAVLPPMCVTLERHRRGRGHHRRDLLPL